VQNVSFVDQLFPEAFHRTKMNVGCDWLPLANVWLCEAQKGLMWLSPPPCF
jgi:hypothetical protein